MAKAKQQRKEAVSFRIEPKIKYLIEIASRVQRRNISNYVEYTLENSLRDVEIEKNKSVLQVAENIWATNEMDRVLRLHEHYPELLNFEEKAIIDLMTNTYRWTFMYNEEIDYLHAQRFWELLKLVNNGDEDAENFLHFVNIFDRFHELSNSELGSNDENYYITEASDDIAHFITEFYINKNKPNKYEGLIIKYLNENFKSIMLFDGKDGKNIDDYNLKEIAKVWRTVLVNCCY